MNSFIGNQPATSFESPKKQVSTSNSGTTITLDYPVTNVADIRLTINAVVQSYDNYSVSGSTLTVGGTLNNDRVEILFVGRTYGSIAPSDGSIVTNSLVDDAITSSKLSSTAVDNTNTNSTLVTGQTAITSLADTDKFLVSDASDSGNLKYVEKQYLPSGGLVKLANYDVSSNVSTITFDDTISDTYANYLLIASNLFCSSTGQTYINYRVGSSTQSDSNYNNQIQSYNSNSAESNARQNSGANIKPHYDINSIQDSGVSFTTWLYNPRDSQTKRSSTIGAIDNASDYHVTFNSACHWTNSSTGVTGIILSRSAGVFTSAGQVTLYGVVK